MAWFERSQSRPALAVPVTFTDVTRGELKRPSWLTKTVHEPPERESAAVVPPPPGVPAEAEALAQQVHVEKRESVAPGSVRPSKFPRKESTHPPAPSPELEALLMQRGMEQGQQQLLESGFDSLIDTVRAFREERVRWLRENDQRAVELAILIAQRVIACELSTRPSLIADVIHEGLEALNDSDKIRIALGEGLSAQRESLLEALSDTGLTIEVVVDPTLAYYGVTLETELGRVDEALETRLSHLRELLEGIRGQE